MQVCTSFQTDNHASTPPLRFLQAGCPSCHPTNSVKALKQWNSGKQVKTDENCSLAARLVYITKPLTSTSSHSPSVENNYQSNVPSCFLLTYFFTYTGWRKLVPSSQCDDLHFTTSHINVISYATEYFVIPHQLRFYNSLSNFTPIGGRRVAVH